MTDVQTTPREELTQAQEPVYQAAALLLHCLGDIRYWLGRSDEELADIDEEGTPLVLGNIFAGLMDEHWPFDYEALLNIRRVLNTCLEALEEREGPYRSDYTKKQVERAMCEASNMLR